MKTLQEFVGGTLVEYKEGCRFNCEWGRAQITRVTNNGPRVEIQTDGKVFLDCAPFGAFEAHDKNGVVYLLPPHSLRAYWSVYYAISPPGVEIPLPHMRQHDPMDLFSTPPREA